MSAFIDAYAEYLERMYEESSDDLPTVDKFTIPKDHGDTAHLLEWCNID